MKTFLTRTLCTLLVGSAVVGCSQPSGPSPLSESQLQSVELDGKVSKWLPSRFSGTISNNLSDFTITSVEVVIHGRTVHRTIKIEPAGTKRFSAQFLFPEDPDFGSVDIDEVEWELVGALAIRR